MKKAIIYCVATLYFMATAQAQCPTQIVDDGSNGGSYTLTLASLANCSNFPIPSDIVIHGQTYSVTSCSENFGVFEAVLGFKGNMGDVPVVLSTSAPLTIPVGGSNCVYGSTGLLVTQQCPTKIADDGGNGGSYTLTLTSLDQCIYYPVPSNITIQGQSYGVTGCSENFGVVAVTLGFNGNPGGVPVVLTTNAPLTIPVGGNSCVFNSLGNPIALPIELLEFKGTPSVSSNFLTWTTVREVSNRGFQVERLTADKKWLPIAFVKSKGAYGKYEFTDNNPLPTSYYRLRQLDNDGTETFSKIITLAAKGTTKLKTYPNPVTDLLIVETESKLDYQILNLLGQEVLNGKAARQVDVSALPKGSYFLKVGAEQVKFVKQ